MRVMTQTERKIGSSIEDLQAALHELKDQGYAVINDEDGRCVYHLVALPSGHRTDYCGCRLSNGTDTILLKWRDSPPTGNAEPSTAYSTGQSIPADS